MLIGSLLVSNLIFQYLVNGGITLQYTEFETRKFPGNMIKELLSDQICRDKVIHCKL